MFWQQSLSNNLAAKTPFPESYASLFDPQRIFDNPLRAVFSGCRLGQNPTGPTTFLEYLEFTVSHGPKMLIELQTKDLLIRGVSLDVTQTTKLILLRFYQ